MNSKKSLESQEKQILAYLKLGYTLTPLQALRKFGCMRLGGRIYDLRSKGHEIDRKMIDVDGKHVAQYWLKKPVQKHKTKEQSQKTKMTNIPMRKRTYTRISVAK